MYSRTTLQYCSSTTTTSSTTAVLLCTNACSTWFCQRRAALNYQRSRRGACPEPISSLLRCPATVWSSLIGGFVQQCILGLVFLLGCLCNFLSDVFNKVLQNHFLCAAACCCLNVEDGWTSALGFIYCVWVKPGAVSRSRRWFIFTLSYDFDALRLSALD